MGIENASSIKELNPDQPQGNESISEGDNHIRVIKNALVKSFPEVDGRVDWTPADFQRIKDFVDNAPPTPKGNGVFASCKWNGTQLMYSHNVSRVDKYASSGYRVNFISPTDGFDHHYAIQATPIATNQRPITIHVTDQRSSWVEFTVAEWDGSGLGAPTNPVGFYMTMIDMIQVEDNAG